MDSFLRFLLGLGDDENLGSGDSRWELSGMPEGFWFFAALTIVVASVVLIIFLYRREHGLGTMRRVVLSALRLGALAIIVLMLLNPRVITELKNKRPGRTFVVLDTSASMAQRDSFRGDALEDVESATGLDLSLKPTRTEIVRAALARHDIVEKLEEKNRVALYSAGERTRRIATPDDIATLEPTGEGTALGACLERITKDAGSDPVAAVVLVTDGRQNTGSHPLDVIRDPARWRSMPVHTVGIGLVEDAKNLSVVEFTSPDTVEVGYPIELEGVIRMSGLRGPVKLTLSRIKARGRGREVVDSRTLDATGSLEETRVKFIDTLDEDGSYLYRLELAPNDLELTRRDNRREVRVVAASEKRRVLLLSGRPTMLYRWVTGVLFKDDGVQVSAWLSNADRRYIQDGNIRLRRLPNTPRDLETYDVVLCFDPDPETLSPEFREALISFVTEQGGGLAYVAGESHTARIARDSGLRRFRAMLPVALEPGAALFGSGESYTKAWRPTLTEGGSGHPVCRLADEVRANEELWSTLQPFYFFHPSPIVRPSGRALMRGPENAVIGAVHQVGFGEVLYFGTDDFWQWNGGDGRILERFWSGVVRYLAMSKKRVGSRTITVETDRDRYKVGDQVRISLRAAGGKEKIDAERIELALERTGDLAGDGEDGAGDPAVDASPEETLVSLFPDAAARGQETYGGVLRASDPGRYRLLYDGKERSTFEVQPASSEWADPSPDFTVLEDLAARTNGSFLTVTDLRELPDRIPDGSVEEVIGRRASTVWDSAALMVLFALLLTIEWALRKLWNLN